MTAAEWGGLSPFYRPILVDSVDSTNLYAKDLARQGEAEGAVVIARSQNAGRGRRGRSFYSPQGDGLYMSVLLRPTLPACASLTLTTKAAVAVYEALRARGFPCEVKWVNDLLLRGRKVCGILTEGQTNPRGRLAWAVVGIGVNLREPDGGFPRELADIAGALYAREALPEGAARELAMDILARFHGLYQGAERCHLAAYRAACPVAGRRILVLGRGEPREALALGIGEDFGLWVRWPGGGEEVLSSGEISTRFV